jgi:hypothetical protein
MPPGFLRPMRPYEGAGEDIVVNSIRARLTFANVVSLIALRAGPRGAQGVRGPQGAPGSDAQLNGVTAGGDLTGSYPNPTIGPGRVGSAAVQDGSLRTVDMAVLKGTATQNFGAIAAQSCANFKVGTPPGLLGTDYVVLDGEWAGFYIGGGAGSLLVMPYASSAEIDLKVCNPTAAPIDPPNVTFHWAAFR